MAGRSPRLKAGSRLRLFGASSALRRTVRVDFARRDLSGKIAHPAGPQGRIQPGVGGDAGNSRLAHKARPARVAGAFAENGIDVSVLPHLTDQDLKDIGVLLGHRRKILAAVAELPGKSPSASKPFPPLVEARDRYTNFEARQEAAFGALSRSSVFPPTRNETGHVP
jgi:SAM domain (Sterile alpha motif)